MNRKVKQPAPLPRLGGGSFNWPLLALVFSLLWGLGCGRKVNRPVLLPELVSPMLIAPNLKLEQSLVIRFGDMEFLSRAVLEKRGDLLDVWLLSPTGVRIGHIRQQGMVVQSNMRLGEWEALDPRFLVQDIRWTFFHRCTLPGESPTRTCHVGNATFVEKVDPQTEELQSREIRWEGGPHELTFEGTVMCAAQFSLPRRITLKNSLLGYGMDMVVERCQILE